jgi:hypothetical protein
MSTGLSEPNWSAFCHRLGRIGPTVLRGVPEDLMWWVTEASEGEDWFLEGVEYMLVDCWGETRDEREHAVKAALERYTGNVIGRLSEEVEYTGDYPPREMKRVLSRVNKIKLKAGRREIDELLACALSPESSEEDEEADTLELSGEPSAQPPAGIGTPQAPGTASATPPATASPADIPVERLPFELLPAGSGEPLLESYRRQTARLPPGFRTRQLDEGRLTKILSLEPSKCYIGTERWRGYVLFDFENAGRAVLECPVEGNATYVLSGDWRPLIRQTKQELRLRYADVCERIVHTESWLSRVREALFRRPKV